MIFPGKIAAAHGRCSDFNYLKGAKIMMKVSEAITKMISLSEGNQHDICHFLKVWGFARTINNRRGGKP